MWSRGISSIITGSQPDSVANCVDTSITGADPGFFRLGGGGVRVIDLTYLMCPI